MHRTAHTSDFFLSVFCERASLKCVCLHCRATGQKQILLWSGLVMPSKIQATTCDLGLFAENLVQYPSIWIYYLIRLSRNTLCSCMKHFFGCNVLDDCGLSAWLILANCSSVSIFASRLDFVFGNAKRLLNTPAVNFVLPDFELSGVH